MSCLFFFWSCVGEQGASEGSGVGRHQPEAVCQPDADPDRPDADAEAAVCESGGGHAQTVAVLRVCSGGEGNVSGRFSSLIPVTASIVDVSQFIKKYI